MIECNYNNSTDKKNAFFLNNILSISTALYKEYFKLLFKS